MKVLQISCLLAVLFVAHALPTTVEDIKRDDVMDKKEIAIKREEMDKKDFETKKDVSTLEDTSIMKKEDIISKRSEELKKDVSTLDEQPIVTKKDDIKREEELLTGDVKKEIVIRAITEITTKKTIETPMPLSEIKRIVISRSTPEHPAERSDIAISEDKKTIMEREVFGVDKELKRDMTVEKTVKRTFVEPEGLSTEDKEIVKKWAETRRRDTTTVTVVKKDGTVESVSKKAVEEPTTTIVVVKKAGEIVEEKPVVVKKEFVEEPIKTRAIVEEPLVHTKKTIETRDAVVVKKEFVEEPIKTIM